MADKIFARYGIPQGAFLVDADGKLTIRVHAFAIHNDGTVFTFTQLIIPLTGDDTSETVELKANEKIRAAFSLPLTPIVWLPRAGII